MEQARYNNGIVLMELLITLTILGILVAIVHTGYQTSMQLIRRHEARANLTSMYIQQQVFFLENSFFASQEELVMPESDFYDYSVELIDEKTFMILAIAKSAQTKDTGCEELTLTQQAIKRPEVCW